MAVTKIVESAYSGKKHTIKSLITRFSGKNIIIYNVSRFSRSEMFGSQLLDYALKCRTRLFFVDEGLIWDRNNQNNRQAILRKLVLAHEESAAIGRRVKDALAYRKAQGYFTGGIAKYGYSSVEMDGGKRLITEQYEQAVITFINMLRQVGTKIKDLNQWVKQLSGNYELIELFYDDHPTDKIIEPLSYNVIADLLNEYEITKRGLRWSSSMISSVVKRDYENVLENLVEMTIKTGFN